MWSTACNANTFTINIVWRSGASGASVAPSADAISPDHFLICFHLYSQILYYTADQYWSIAYIIVEIWELSSRPRKTSATTRITSTSESTASSKIKAETSLKYLGNSRLSKHFKSGLPWLKKLRVATRLAKSCTFPWSITINRQGCAGQEVRSMYFYLT